MTEKYYNDKGEVAVLYSKNYGAGWYSWNKDYPEILFDKTIVTWVLKGKKDDIDKYIDEKYEDKIYTGGLSELAVEFLPEGTKFRIDEYDGWESVEIIDDIEYILA